LSEERRLIALAQKGSKKSSEEIVLRHIGFLIFRLHKKAFPSFLKRFGEDLVSEATFILYQKIKTYDLDYCDKQGNPKPVKFVSYIWKRVDGFILDSLKKEIRKEHEAQSAEIRGGVSEMGSWCRPFAFYTPYGFHSRAVSSAGKASFSQHCPCLTLRRPCLAGRRGFPDFPGTFGNSI